MNNNYTVYNYTKKYYHLDKNKRLIIEQMLQKNKSLRQIAKILGVNVSTVSREVKRNSHHEYGYLANYANYKTKKRKYHKYYFQYFFDENHQKFNKVFKEKYNKNFFGVKATLNWIKNNTDIKIPSFQTIFNWIKKGWWLIKRNERLRKIYKKGGKRTSHFVKRLIKNEYVFPIWARPKSIDLRLEYGHWEADLIIGKKSNGFDNLLVMIERKTRYVVIGKMPSKDGFKLNELIKKLIIKNNLTVKTITTDNGIEFEKIGLLAKWLNIKIYKSEPYASFQRGSNEHVNGIVRRLYKKGFDFTSLNDKEIQKLEDNINNMPREIFNWESAKNQLIKEENNLFI